MIRPAQRFAASRPVRDEGCGHVVPAADFPASRSTRGTFRGSRAGQRFDPVGWEGFWLIQQVMT
jgi:hypothetical protein